MPRRRRPVAERAEAPLDAAAPASVEHARLLDRAVRCSRSRALRTSGTRRTVAALRAPRGSNAGPDALAGSARRVPRIRLRPHGSSTRGVVGEDVPDGQDPQRRPGRPRRRRQDLAGRGAALRRRRDPPPGPGRGRHHRLRLRPRGAAAPDLGVARARAVRARRPQGQRARRARATPTSSATSPPRSGPPTSRCSSSRRSRASRCRPRSRGSWPRSAASRARSSSTSSTASARRSRARSTSSRSAFGAGVAPLQLPIGEEADAPRRRRAAQRHRGHLRRRHRRRAPRARCPAEMETEEHAVHDALVEGIVVGDDDLMERYLGDEKIEIDELARRARRRASRAARVFPVLCGSATKLIGVDRLAHFIVEEAPAPDGRRRPGRRVRVQDDRRPVRRAREPVQGAAGHGEADDVLVNGRTMADERLHQLFDDARQGAGHRSTEVAAGDIAAVAKLADTTTGDVLAAQGRRRRRRRRSRRPSRCSRSRSTPSRRATRTSSPTRCTACRTRTRCCASSATPRRTRRCCAGMGETHLVDRARAAARASSASRSRPKTCGRVPRDDHRRRPRPRASSRSRPAATASSRVACAAGRAARARRRASSSSTRSSAA